MITFFTEHPTGPGAKELKTFLGPRAKVKALGYIIDRKKYPSAQAYKKNAQGCWVRAL